MGIASKLLQFFQWICCFNFGNFEKEEFKKYIRMGLIFILIVGVLWSLRCLKDAVFISLVDKYQLPFAKTFSLIAMVPWVLFYTKLLNRFSRERMLMLLPAFYGVATLAFSAIMLAVQGSPEAIAARSLLPYIATKAVGYLWYFFVESYCSLTVALFWAFSSDTTDPTSAKRGFPFIYALGQLGGIIMPYGICSLPHRLGLQTDALSIACLGSILLLIIPLVRYFLAATPKYLLQSFQGEVTHAEKKEEKPKFFEGLQLLLSHKYLLGMFAVNFLYEFIVTIFDFNFKVAAGEHYSGVALSKYLSTYASSVNIVSFLCLLLGISNITRILGVWAALAAMPFIFAGALTGFLTLNSLNFLFMLMVCSKAINYALMGPALKQLYIPTTASVRFKAQAWIETFGGRTSKEAGSLFNMIHTPLQSAFGTTLGHSYYILTSGIIGFPLLAIWLLVALFLGKSYTRALKQQTVVC